MHGRPHTPGASYDASLPCVAGQTPVAIIVQLVRGQGVLGRRGFAVESAAAQICREAGARVTTDVLMRDLDLGVPRGLTHDAWKWWQTVCFWMVADTTLVSTLHFGGTARRGPWMPPTAVKSGRTPSSWVPAVEPRWWFSQVKSPAGGKL